MQKICVIKFWCYAFAAVLVAATNAWALDTPSGPKLTNIRTINPGAHSFNEGYGFSLDDKQIIFCSDYQKLNALNSQIYVVDTASGTKFRCLTDMKNYHEHASYYPDGRHVVWITNQGNKNGGTDWWIMRADGSQKRRLTHFNQTGFPEAGSRAERVWACLTSWAPNGTELLRGSIFFDQTRRSNLAHGPGETNF